MGRCAIQEEKLNIRCMWFFSTPPDVCVRTLYYDPEGKLVTLMTKEETQVTSVHQLDIHSFFTEEPVH